MRCDEASAVDVLHHTVAITLSLDPNALAGEGELRVRTRRATGAVALDAHGLRFTKLAAARRSLRFVQDDKQLCIQLPAPVPAGQRVTLRLVWSAAAPAAGLHFAKEQVWAGYDAAAWMPTVQDSAQRATLELRLIAPQTFKVVASGRRSGSQPLTAAQVVHTFALDRPAPPFLFAFAAGHFDEAALDVDGFKLRALGPPGTDLAGALARTAPMLRFLVERTGRRPPGREYVQVFVDGDAAQEAAGMALLAASSLDDARSDPQDDWIFSHELAHQWFGWLIPCADFHDFWLNEGMATFLVAATKEARWGRAAYDQEIAHWRTRSAKAHADGRDAPLSPHAPGVPLLAPPRDTELPVRGITYYRGALALDKLRHELGDPIFWSGMRRYVRTQAGQNTRTEQLRAAFETASGRDLEPFFSRWIYTPAPDL